MELSDYELKGLYEWSSLVLLRVYNKEEESPDEDESPRVPQGYAFVKASRFGDRAVWKLPSGHKGPGDTPQDTAWRETVGETGLNLNISAFHYVGKEGGYNRRGEHTHWRCFFIADISKEDLCWMHSNHLDNEGEIQGYFSVEEFYKLVREGKFMKGHYEFLKKYNLILPLGRDEAEYQPTEGAR